MAIQNDPHDIVEYSRIDEQFRIKLKSLAKDVAEDLDTLVNTPNCSCRAKVVKWISMNNEEIKPILTTEISNKIIENKKIVDQKNREKRPQTQLPPNYIGGHSFVIDPTEDAYQQLINKIITEKKAFRGLSVISDVDESGNHVWRVLMY